MKVTDLDTPVPLVDLPKMERNIRRMADFARQAGVHMRPHVKTHKIVAMVHAQLAAGAGGITVAKLVEAEVMGDAGITDILVCYPIVGPTSSNVSRTWPDGPASPSRSIRWRLPRGWRMPRGAMESTSTSNRARYLA